jgi:predicted signal transduction protein with EAL and GGDEF domain
LGGEEFVAVLPGNLADATIAAERVRAAFQTAAVTVDGGPLGATVSVGAACGAPGTDIVALLSAADAALYRAKSNGRNRVEGSEQENLIAAKPPVSAKRNVRMSATAWHGAGGIPVAAPPLAH